MVADVRWFALLFLLLQVFRIEGRVIDDDDQDVLGRLVPQEDPYEEDAFEEDRYEEPELGAAVKTEDDDRNDAGSPIKREHLDRYGEPMMSDQPEPGSPLKTEDEERPYRSCTSPADCYPDECCRIGMQRFSEPACTRLGNEGDFCRVGQEPVNTTLFYPNGSSKELVNGHVLFCPCSDGLTCLRALCRPYKELYLMDKTQENAL